MEDLDGWEVLPDDGFLQIHDDGGQKIFSRKYGAGSRNVFKNYFICPDSKSTKFVETTEDEEETEHYSRSRVVPKRFVPVTIIQLEDPPDHNNQEDFKKITEIPYEKTSNPIEAADQDPVSQVLFKKMKEPEFVDMKLLESPTRSMKPPPLPVDAAAAAAFQLVEGKGETFDMKISSPRSLMKCEERENISHGGWEEHDSASGDDGFNLWKWSLTGIGAICSFSVAAATVCIIFFGTQQRNTKQQYDDNHKLQFHIYANDKRLKEAVRNATKLKEAVSAMRGSAPPMSRGTAHITFGGYYDEAL